MPYQRKIPFITLLPMPSLNPPSSAPHTHFSSPSPKPKNREGTVPLRRDLVEDLLIKRLKRKVKTLTDDELATILENLMQQSSNTAFPTDLLLPPPAPPRIDNYLLSPQPPSSSSSLADKVASKNRDRNSNAAKLRQEEEEEEEVDLTRSLMMPPKRQEEEGAGDKEPATPLSPPPPSSSIDDTTAKRIDPLIKSSIISSLIDNPIGRMTLSAPIIVMGAYLGFVMFKKSENKGDNNNSSSSSNGSSGNSDGALPSVPTEQQDRQQGEKIRSNGDVTLDDEVSKGNIWINALAALSTFLFSTEPIDDDDSSSDDAAATSTSRSSRSSTRSAVPTTSQQPSSSSSSSIPPPLPSSSSFTGYTENIPTPDKNGILWRKKGDDESTIKKNVTTPHSSTTTKTTTLLPPSHKSNGDKGSDFWRMPLEQLKATIVVLGEETLTEAEKQIINVQRGSSSGGSGGSEETMESKVEMEEEDKEEEAEEAEELNKLEVMDNIEPAGFNGVRRRRLVVGRGQR
jgi:hypothetical protein